MDTITIRLTNQNALDLCDAIDQRLATLDDFTAQLLQDDRRTDAANTARRATMLRSVRDRIADEAKRHFIGW